MIPLDEGTAQRVAALPPRRLETLVYIAKGFEFTEIASLMHVSLHAINDQTKRIYKALDVNNKVEAAVIACKCGLV